MAGSTTVVDLLIRGRDLASGAIGQVRDAVGGLSDRARAALEPLRSFAGLITAAIGAGGAKELIDRADAYTNLSNQVRIASKGEEDYQASIAAVASIAKDANSYLASTASLYGKVKQNADSLGISQQQIADVTAVVAKGMQLSGASSEAAAGATLQFTQALGSGVFRGEEFNSVIEASPALIKAIADGLGVAVGEMRGLAEAGQLTSDRVVQALLSQKTAIDDVYGKLPQTVGQAIGQLSNAATLFVGKLNEQTGVTRSLGDGLKFLANNMDAVAAVAGAAFAASMVKGAQSTAQFVTASLAARDAARQQAIAAEQQQAANLAAAQGQVAAAQAAYNRALAEQRATQAQLAALESLAGLFASEQALTLARAQSSAAVAAATAATERYAAAQAALNALQGPAASSAGLFGRAMSVLAGPGGLILAAVSAFGLLYGSFSKQKPATDDLTQSVEQFTESLNKMNKAQAEAALLKLGDALDQQTQSVADAKAEVDRLNEVLTYYQKTGVNTELTTRALTEANGALADETSKLHEMEDKRAALLDRIKSVQQDSTSTNFAQVTAYNQQVVALDKLADTLSKRESYLRRVNDSEIAETQALIEKAKALGDTRTAEQLTINLAAQRAKASDQAAALARAEAVAENTKVAALEKVRDLQGQLTPKQQEALALARESAVAKNAEATAAQLLAEQLKVEAESEATGLAAKERAVAKTDQVVTASGDYLSALQAVATAQLSGVQAEIDLANAKGDTYTAQAKTVELAKLEAQWAKALAEAKQAEIAAEKASTEAKIAKLQATNDNTEATQKEIAALQLQLVALGKQAEAEALAAKTKELAAQQVAAGQFKQTDSQEGLNRAMEEGEKTADGYTKTQAGMVKHTSDSSTALQGLANYLDTTRKAMDGLSASTRLLFEAELASALERAHNVTTTVGLATKAWRAYQAGASDSSQALAKFQGELDHANALIEQSREKLLFSGNGFTSWEASIEMAAGKAKKAFYEQAIQAERLRATISDMTDSGRIDVGQLAEATRAAKDDFGLLDDQDLSNLRSAISDAQQRMKALQEETITAKDRVSELNAEIAREKGDTAAADALDLQLEKQQKLAEVENNLAQARLENNRELIALYESQRSKLQELYDLKSRNLEKEQQQTKTETTSTTTTSSSGGTTSSAAPSKTYQLNLVGDSGQTLTATTNTDPTAFLDALTAAKKRSLA